MVKSLLMSRLQVSDGATLSLIQSIFMSNGVVSVLVPVIFIFQLFPVPLKFVELVVMVWFFVTSVCPITSVMFPSPAVGYWLAV